jgi:hypothetical protein
MRHYSYISKLQVSDPRVQRKGCGILTYARNPTITENKFYNNLEAINVGPHGGNGNYLSTTLNLRCNYFEKWSNDLLNQTHYGLVIQDGTNLNDIGGDNTNNTVFPNANVWPATNRSQTFGQWTSPNNWQSLLWGSGVSGKYWRYENEFVGSGMPTFYNSIIRNPSTISCTEVIGNGNGINVIEVCNGNLPPSTQPYFPLRQGVIAGTDLANQVQLIKLYPNPTAGNLSVDLGTTVLSDDVSLSILDPLGRTVLQLKPEEVHVNIDLKDLPSGLYKLMLVGQGVSHSVNFVKQ